MNKSRITTGIHLLRISGSDSVMPVGQGIVEHGPEVNKDAFIDQGYNGFEMAVKRKLAELGGGKLPDDFLLVLSERLENAFLEFSSSSVGNALSNLLSTKLSHGEYAIYDEAGDRYKQADAEYIPVLVCELGYSQSFKRALWCDDNRPASRPEYPTCTLTKDLFCGLCENLKKLHEGNIPAPAFLFNRNFFQ